MSEAERAAAAGYPAAPIATAAGTVPPDWIDYNGHMNVAWYTLAFDRGLDSFLDEWLGIGPEFVRASGHGPYALQAHYHYLGELREGEAFRPRFRLLDADAKRLHVFGELMNEATGAVAATLEQVILNVDLATRRAAPYPDWAQARLQAMKAAHAALPRPAQAGAAIGLARTRPP
jgi:acyl-CoA thioester hydrolase